MNKESRRGKGFRGTSLVAALVLCLGMALAAPDLEAAKRQGAQVIVNKNDGVTIEGELLAVRGSDLIVMDSSKVGVPINIRDVRDVKMLKKGNFWRGAGIGFASGAVCGVILGVTDNSKSRSGSWSIQPFSNGVTAVFGGVSLGLLGGLLGGALTSVNQRETFEFNANSSEEINVKIAKLRKLAKERS